MRRLDIKSLRLLALIATPAADQQDEFPELDDNVDGRRMADLEDRGLIERIPSWRECWEEWGLTGLGKLTLLANLAERFVDE